jgi:hypothetical protein
MSGSGYLKFRNDRGVPEICIGGDVPVNVENVR